MFARATAVSQTILKILARDKCACAVIETFPVYNKGRSLAIEGAEMAEIYGLSSLGFPVLGQGYLFAMGIVDLISLPWDTLTSAITSTVAAVYDNLYEKVFKVVPVITGILPMVILKSGDALYQRLFRYK